MASYYVWSAAAGAANGTSWVNAYTTLTLAFSGKAAGDVFYVAHDHAETTAGAITLTVAASTVSNPIKVICANRAGSVPPVSADRRATAQVTSTGVGGYFFNGFTHYDGIIFIAGNSASLSQIQLPQAGVSNTWQRFDNCSLRIASTAAGSKIGIGSSGGTAFGVYVVLNNTTVSFVDIGQAILIGGVLRWQNTPSALLGTIPTSLFVPLTNCGGDVECIGVDLSAAGAGKTLVVPGAFTTVGVTYRFIDCKLNAAVTKSGAPNSYGSGDVDLIRSGSTGNYTVFRQRISGTLDHETAIVRTGGATDGTTPISWKVVTTATCTYSLPFECPVIAIWNDTTGSAKTATIEGIWGGGVVPNDDEIWVDVEYLGDASAPQGSFVNDGKADLLATAAGQTSSSATWGGSTTKFKLETVFTAQMKGWIYCRVKIGKASTTAYIDPLVTLT